MGEVLEAAVAATGSGAELVWIPDEQLQAAEAQPWVELPLWIPAAEFPGTWTIGTERAQASGLGGLPSPGSKPAAPRFSSTAASQLPSEIISRMASLICSHFSVSPFWIPIP